ncbi:hypothetical protein [Pseudomonas sp. I2]|uniref:hypothetical protein n=1 Tax=Pseudomonas sp. I2 TaxID=1338438 RepID=UPI0034D716D8
MQPEHHDFSHPVFLPVTAEVCQGLLDAQGDAALEALSEAELAAVLVIQHLAKGAGQDLRPAAAEKLLAKLLAWAADSRHAPGVGLLTEARRLFDAQSLHHGLRLLKKANLRLMKADEVAARDYLHEDGTWDFTFSGHKYQAANPFSQQVFTGYDKERWLTREQDKLLRIVRADPGEDLHIQGYAGIGKSYLLGALMDCLPSGRVLALARTPGKLDALRKRIGPQAHKALGKTFEAFAHMLLSGPRPRPLKATARHMDKRALAEQLGIVGFRQYGARQTLDICLELLKNYCESRSHSLTSRHLPFFEVPLSRQDSQVLLEYSSRLWSYLQIEPAWDSQTGFPALLAIKRASLAGFSVPAYYSHVIIDESQDVPESLLQIIERGRQALITLGDEYQRAKGPGFQQRREVRQRDVALSVRSGAKVERLINPLINVHSYKSKLAFAGASPVDVSVKRYPEGFVPPAGCVVLTASRWDTMKWAMEMTERDRGIGFPDAQDMQHFMRSATQLSRAALYAHNYYEQDAQTAHPYFAHMTDWQQVRHANQHDESFLWVENRLREGFRVGDLTRLESRVSDHPDNLMLMMAQDAGGLEFDQVLLTPGLMSLGTFKDAYEFDARICAVYIALSRARRQLYLPYDVEEWIAYHKGKSFRESHGY